MKKKKKAPKINKNNITKSVVMAACNEGSEVRETVYSILEAEDGDIEVIVIDDASDESKSRRILNNLPDDVYVVRTECRRGCSKSRHLGLSMATGQVQFVVDAHMRFKKYQFSYLAERAQQTQGFVFAGVNGHTGVKMIEKDPSTLLKCVWCGGNGEEFYTNGMMGACYGIPREKLDQMGGWIQFPGRIGFDEEAMSILAAKHEIPILCCGNVESRHDFRQQKQVPYEIKSKDLFINFAALYQILFDIEIYEHYKSILKKFEWNNDKIEIKNDVFLVAETQEQIQYGLAIKDRCKKTDGAFFEQLWASEGKK